MRFLFVASNFGRSWATETHLAHDLEALGHQVHKIHETASLGQMEALGSEADAVFYMKSRGLPPEAIAMWERLEARGVRTASYHLDLYYGLARQHEIGLDPMWRTEYVFTADGDPVFQEFCDAREINHHWMPAAIVSDEVGRGTFLPKYREDGIDIVFVGKSSGYHPEWPFREEMIRHLKAMYGRRFRVFGHNPGLWDRDQNDLFASVKIVVGDSLALPGHMNYWSNRIYETIGRGGFLVFPNVSGIDAEYVQAAEYLAYKPGSVDSMFERVEFALSLDPELRQKIVEMGIERTRKDHTYKHRALRMLELMGFNHDQARGFT